MSATRERFETLYEFMEHQNGCCGNPCNCGMDKALTKATADMDEMLGALRGLIDAYKARFSPIDGAMLRLYEEPQAHEIKAATKRAKELLARYGKS